MTEPSVPVEWSRTPTLLSDLLAIPDLRLRADSLEAWARQFDRMARSLRKARDEAFHELEMAARDLEPWGAE